MIIGDYFEDKYSQIIEQWCFLLSKFDDSNLK